MKTEAIHLDSPIAFEGGQLRRLRPGDLAAFQAYRSSPGLGRFQGWSIMSDAQAADFLGTMGAMPLFPQGDWVQLGIATAAADGDRLVGDIGLFLAADGRSGEIGFTLAPSAQGRGIGTEAVRKATRLFFGLTDAECIEGVTDARNTASVRLLRRAGFQYRESRSAIFRGEACTEEVHVLHRGNA